MTWLDQKDDMDTSGGRLKRSQPPASRKELEKLYSIAEVARIFKVDKRTIVKWMDFDEDAPNEAPIPPDAWFKLPNGNIRIREWIILKLMGEEKKEKA